MKKQNKDKIQAKNNKISNPLKSAAVRRTAILLAVLMIVISAGLIINRIVENAENESEEVIPDIPVSDVSTNEIPDIKSSYGEYGSYLNLDGMVDDPIGSLNELDEYSRTFRIIHSYGGISDGESMTLTKSGNYLKAESDSREIILNKNQISADYGSQKIVSETDEEGFFSEVGITSLSMLKEMCFNVEKYEKTLTLSDDRRFVTADLFDRNTGITMNYEIDVESGIVITERFYSEGVLYRFVFTENISKNINTDAGFFAVSE